MRYTTLPLLSALALSSIPLLANDIYPTQEYYNATLFPKPPAIDGNLSDWAGVPVIADPSFWVPKGLKQPGKYVIFEPYNGGIWTGPDDWTSNFQIAWDANNLYIAITVTDDSHESLATGPSSAWNGDSVQLMIADETRSKQIALYNYALGGQDGALGDLYIHNEAGGAADPACGCDTKAAIVRDTAKQKTYYELQLPAAAMGLTAPLTAGTKIGLGVCINNGDVTQPGQPDQTGQKGWGGWGTHSIVFGKTPSETGLLTLVTNQPTTDRLFFASVDPELTSFTFRVTDKGASILDPASVKLAIDGQAVTLTASAKKADSTDFGYTNAIPYASGSTHTYLIQAKDTTGALVTSSNTFTALIYATLSASLVVPTSSVDTTKPGFLWEMSQVDSVGSYAQNSNARTKAQLAGLLGPNTADPNAQGVALGPGVPNSNPNLPIDFQIPTIIALDRNGGTWGSWGSQAGGDQMPGSPGTGGGTDNQAARIVAYVDLPAGLVTMGVNSDDGFLTGAGNWNDAFSPVLGQFDGGRGPADTLFTFFVSKAGIYPFYTLWENGGGGSDIAWFAVIGGKQVALNDTANGGYKTYRQATVAAIPGYVQSVSPAIGAAGVPLITPIQAVLVDSAGKFDPASVTMTVNGAAVKPTVNKSGGTTTVTLNPTARFPSGSQQTVGLTFADMSTPPISRTVSWTFTVLTPPPPAASAFPGTKQIGVRFDVDLDPATAGSAANYKVNGAAVTSALVRTNVANELTNEKNLVQLTVATPVTADFKVSVSGLKDAIGGAYPAGDLPGTVLNLTSTDIGSPSGQPGGPDPLFPSTVTTWGPGNFDVYCNGNDYWNNADGFNFLWAPKTNAFDVKVRVVSVSPIDNWAAGAVEVRDAPPTPGDFANGHGWELSRHYFAKVDYGGPTPSLHGTGSGANTYEFNGRKAPGDPTLRETSNSAPGGSVGWGGTGPGNPSPVPFPNAWIRIARVMQGTNDHLMGYSSSDGVNWSLRQDVDLTDANHAGFLDLNGNPAGPWPKVCYVGLGSTSHTGVGNPPQNNDGSVGSFWYSPVSQPFGCYVIYRDYGDFAAVGPPPAVIKLSFNVSGGNLVLSWNGAGKLQSKTDLNATSWTDVGTANPATVPIAKTGNLFLRVVGQ